MRIKLYLTLIIFILIFSSTSEGARIGNMFSESQDFKRDHLSDYSTSSKPYNKDMKNVIFDVHNVFTENFGQLQNDDVRFYAQNGGIWFTDDGVWFEIREEIKQNRRNSLLDNQGSTLETKDREPETREYKRVILKQEFIDANQVKPIGKYRIDWRSNFFYGNDSSKWYVNVHNYQEIFYENLYDGIDLRYYTNENGLKYDLIVHPGADIQQIRIRFKGANNILIEDFTNLIVNTAFGSLMDRELYIFQKYGGQQHQINGKFVLFNNNEYGFELLQDYQRNEMLIIDPEVRLEFSTYFGGTGGDLGYSVVSDPMGNIYVTGLTYSSDFPTTTGVLDTIFNGSGDAFVFKLNPSMSSVHFSTFIGGSGVEYGRNIAIDTSNNIYVTGYTGSQDFPTTKNAYDTSHNGNDDIFIFKLNQNGSALIFSTFVGGSNHEWGLSINVDSSYNIFITGRSRSTNFPVTFGAANIGNFDVIILKLNSAGSSLIYSRVFGGTNFDCGVDSVIDPAGNIYVTGYTQSNNFNTTPGVYDPTWNGNYDVFILKLNKTGLSLDYSTYLGGSNAESASGIDLDASGNAVITGYTSSSNFPNTTGVFDPTYNSMNDGFISKVDTKGINLLFSSFVGGSNQDYGNDIVVDLDGDIYVTGQTASTDFNTTQDAINKSHIGNTDIFFLKCDQNATKIIYSTYIGGTNTETITGMDLNSLGDVYITGGTTSTDFPISAGAINTSNNGGIDIFVIKFATRTVLNINSLLLLKDDLPTDMIYSKLRPYTFRVGVTDTVSFTDLEVVKLILDPQDNNIQLALNLSTGEFKKLYDPNDYIILESTSKFENDIYWWTIDFDVTFNWTYPTEHFQDLEIVAISKTLSSVNYTAKGIFQVENDLIFKGNLSVSGDNARVINEDTLVRGGEILGWANLTPVYENTTDVYPLDDEFDVTIYDELGSSWNTSPTYQQPIYIETITPNITYNSSFTYYIKLSDLPSQCDRSNNSFSIMLSRIPPESDETNETFQVKIDAENVTFYNAIPNNLTWQTTTDLLASINITDVGGGIVDGKSVSYRISTNNGDNWNGWKLISNIESGVSIIPQDYVTLKEGVNNLIKWQAKDSVGNGPNESKPSRILIDTTSVAFSNFQPLAADISKTEEIEISLTISDGISGVDASTIEYAISRDRGNNWGSWQPIIGLDNSMNVQIDLNLTLPNGSDNMIKWRASDIAGNGPTESLWFSVLINTWTPTIKPSVELLSPLKGRFINKTNVNLSWMLANIINENVTYDIYFGNSSKIEFVESNITNNSFFIEDLVDGEKYFWYVIPWFEDTKGFCTSGIWWFEIELPKDSDYFKIDINGPGSISLFPGENKSIELTIMNLGNTRDLIKIELLAGNFSQYLSLDNYSILTLNSKSDGLRKLNINVPNNARSGIYQILITAISINSGEVEKDNHILIIEVQEPIQPKPEENDDITNDTKKEKIDNLLLYLIIAVIIIIIIILALTFVLKKRKKHDETKLLPGGTYAMKPGALPSPVITLDQISTPTQTALLPSTTTEISPGQAQVKSIPTQILAKSTQELIQQFPQLPPAKIQEVNTEEKQADEDTKTITQIITPQPLTTPESTTATTPVLAQPITAPSGPIVHLPETPLVPQPTPTIDKPQIEQAQSIDQLPQQISTSPIIKQIPEPEVKEVAEVSKLTPIEQTPTPVAQPAHQNLCSTCSQPLTFYSQNNKYYCHQCQKYV